jgi:hypothetical protein
LEEGSGDLADEDNVEAIAFVVAKVNTGLQQLRKEFTTPKDYARKMLEQYSHKDNIIASLILSSVNKLDPEVLHKPEEFRNMVAGQILEEEIGEDVKGIISVFGNDVHRVSYKDMNRALQELEKEIGLINIKGKKNIKNVKGDQKIEFSGYPSVYKLPPDISQLKKVMSNQKIIQLVVRVLKKMGLLDNLAFIVEGFCHIVRFSYIKEENTTYGIIKLSTKMIDSEEYCPDVSGWKQFAETILFLDELHLKLWAKKTAEFMIEIPPLYYKILLYALSKSI